jgi:uncharacterized membrane protein
VREWLVRLTEQTIFVIDFMALVVVAVATVEAFLGGFRVMSRSGHERRRVWLRYARWLIAGLTFQLAADLLETSIRTSWVAIGQLASIAVVRTFFNFFLERDVTEIRERQQEPVRASDRSEDVLGDAGRQADLPRRVAEGTRG